MRLSEYLSGYAKKRLAAVDLPHLGSNQHELNAVSDLRNLLGDSKISGPIHWLLMHDDEEDPVAEDGAFTFYDARAEHATRTEWRFYYSEVSVLYRVKPGDLLVIAKPRGGVANEVFAYLFPKGSSWERKAEFLFGAFRERVDSPAPTALQQKDVELAEAVILRMMGVALSSAPFDVEQFVSSRLPAHAYPSTAIMAELARESCGDVSSLSADEALTKWLKREEQIFYALERRIVGSRLAAPNPFADVDQFLEYSLSVQNRRKARMGWSFEHQLDAVFKRANLPFDHPGRTEGRSTPDFLFPGNREYRDREFDSSKLHMLGAKSTCKDRWRQVLAEAERIKTKHLCTLEPAISEAQTDEMSRHGLVLIVPATIKPTFTRRQQGKIVVLAEFIHRLQTQWRR